MNHVNAKIILRSLIRPKLLSKAGHLEPKCDSIAITICAIVCYSRQIDAQHASSHLNDSRLYLEIVSFKIIFNFAIAKRVFH